VIRESLAARVARVSIMTADVRRPLIVRNLLSGDFAGQMADAYCESVFWIDLKIIAERVLKG